MLATIIINIVLILLSVLVHYESLAWISRLFRRLFVRHRYRLVLGVGGALCAHALEVWIFAIAYWLMSRTGYFGRLGGNFDGSLLDCVYYSFVTYTSLGLGDIEPFGMIRFVTGLETLTGLVLIAWTASFLYIEMQHYWSDRPGQ